MSDALAAQSIKKMTLRELEKSDESYVYILNATKPKGAVNFNAKTGDNSVPVRVPATWIPVDLSTQIDRQDLVKNKDFRRLHARGDLIILDTDEAERFFQKNETAQRERSNILNIDYEIKKAEENLTNKTSETTDRLDHNEANPKIQSFLLRSQEEPAADIISELESSISEFEQSDIKYLLDNTKTTEIKKWAGNTLRAMKNS